MNRVVPKGAREIVYNNLCPCQIIINHIGSCKTHLRSLLPGAEEQRREVLPAPWTWAWDGMQLRYHEDTKGQVWQIRSPSRAMSLFTCYIFGIFLRFDQPRPCGPLSSLSPKEPWRYKLKCRKGTNTSILYLCGSSNNSALLHCSNSYCLLS